MVTFFNKIWNICWISVSPACGRQALYKLANKLPWEELEKAFEGYYSDLGRPALPIRLMAGLLLLKPASTCCKRAPQVGKLENLSDERVCAAWARDAYLQYCLS